MKKLVVGILFLLTAATSTANDQQFATLEWLSLSSGVALENCRIGYRTSGELNEDRSNIIVFPTWFTGQTETLFSAGLIGPGKLADTDKFFVVAIDALGNGVSCSPSNTDAFPRISTEDMVRSQHWLLTEHLGVDHVRAVMGISMGGMQAFRWMSTFPEFMDKVIPIDGSPRMTSYDLLQWQTQLKAIEMLQAASASNREITGYLAYLNLLNLWTPDYFVENVPPEKLPEMITEA